jgi:hypothetical protein
MNSPNQNKYPPTPPLTRIGCRAADATLEAAKFQPTQDGKRVVRQYVVHGMRVTEFFDADRASVARASTK